MNNVNSLKDAIDITLLRLNYNKDDIDIIKKLINKALVGETIYFTSAYGAREYVKNITKEELLKELITVSKSNSTEINEVINSYIDNCFKSKENVNSIADSDLDKISKKLRYFSTISSNDEEFNSNIWNYFTNVFVGKEENISLKEIRDDMISAAINSANLCYGDKDRIKPVDKNSKDITQMDAVILAKDFADNEEIDQLYKNINSNQIFSGVLLQNLFDYTYFKKDLINKKICKDIDKELENIEDLKEKADALLKIINGKKTKNINLSRNKVLKGLLINTLNLSIYTNNKKSIDYDEKKLYIGNSMEYNDEIIKNRIITNNKLATTILENNFNNFNDKELYFLTNIYVISRSIEENKKKLNNSIYFGSEEQIKVYQLLNDKEYDLSESKKKVA